MGCIGRLVRTTAAECMALSGVFRRAVGMRIDQKVVALADASHPEGMGKGMGKGRFRPGTAKLEPSPLDH